MYHLENMTSLSFLAGFFFWSQNKMALTKNSTVKRYMHLSHS